MYLREISVQLFFHGNIGRRSGFLPHLMLNCIDGQECERTYSTAEYDRKDAEVELTAPTSLWGSSE